MNYLNKILSEDQINDILDTFDEGILKNLDEDNIKYIIAYLNINNIYFIDDIITLYLDLFLIDKDLFIKKFELLKKKYSYDFVKTLETNLSILEEMLV